MNRSASGKPWLRSKHGKPARQSLKQVKKTEVDWTEKQIDKYQDAY